MTFRLAHRFLSAALVVVSASAASVAHADGARLQKVYDKKATPLAAGPLLVTKLGSQHLSQQQYDQLKYVGTEMLKRFPPSTHYYVGLGRSPASVISMIQNLAADPSAPEKLAMNFPASGVHDGGVHDDASYFRHLDALLPKEVVSGKRSIVLLDRSRPYGGQHSGGESLYLFKQILERYLTARGSSVKVEALGFAYGPLNPAYKLTHLAFDMNTRPELERVSMPHYEEVAEYPHHRIAPNLQPPARRPEYGQYKAQMLERMRRDPELDAFLDKHLSESLRPPSVEEQAKAKAEADRVLAAAHADRQKAVATARAFPKTMRTKLDALITSLPERAEEEGHPYLSQNGEALNKWLVDALAEQKDAAKLDPAVDKAGPNLVAGAFMDRVEQARTENKIRNRDYRRLMGHALSAATMNEEMTKALVARYDASKHFRREITEEGEAKGRRT